MFSSKGMELAPPEDLTDEDRKGLPERYEKAIIDSKKLLATPSNDEKAKLWRERLWGLLQIERSQC